MADQLSTLDLDALERAIKNSHFAYWVSPVSPREVLGLIQHLRFAESVRDEYIQRLGEAERHAEARIAQLERVRTAAQAIVDGTPGAYEVLVAALGPTVFKAGAG